MSNTHRLAIASCLSFCWVAAAYAADTQPSNAGTFLVAANEPACSAEAKSNNEVELAQARIQAAEADLKLDLHGRCRPEALRLEQSAYQALETLTKSEQADKNAAVKQQHLQAIQQTEALLRTAEQDVNNSMKNDRAGNVGVDVTPLDNAMHALDGGYHMAANAEAAPGAAPAAGSTMACEADAGANATPEERVMARLNAARTDLSGKYRGACRQAALDALAAAGKDLEALAAGESKQASFPNDAVKEKQRISAITRAQKYQQSAVATVQEAMQKDPQGGKIGVNVTPIDNALATLKANYGG